MPLGNGTLGAAVWAAGGFTAQLNRSDTFPQRKSPGWLTIPGLAALTGAPDFSAHLDLYDGTLVESGGGMTATIYTRADKDELVVDVTGADPASAQTAQLVQVVDGNDESTVVVASTSAAQIAVPAVNGRSYLVQQVSDPVGGRTVTPVTGTPATQARTLGSVSIGLTAAGSLVSAASNRCMDDPGGSTTNGTQIDIWDCGGGTNQKWTPTSSKTLTVLGKCLDASGAGTTPGTKVIIYTCSGSANQQWIFKADGSIQGVQSGLCLDVTAGATANGTKLQLWTCTGAANQRWSKV
ncbi:ricin-type beta-trefoil lectin domain protein [Streptomyces griseus]|uniref:RICIN domain-containing protein n=1 Tax=Streptomyces griseus TaxID=1911 RepID=UPI00131CD646|nr:ricin-type beta-trefoil lectin domain protein [Streptomyces griseus]